MVRLLIFTALSLDLRYEVRALRMPFISIARKFKTFLWDAFELAALFVYRKKFVPVVYFQSRPNVGDDLNAYLIPRIDGRPVCRVNGRFVKNVLGIGSIMHFGTNKSHVWGSGIISAERVPDLAILEEMKFFALRGQKTVQLLESRGLRVGDVALGDPAILMPDFYQPSRKDKKYKLGVVPHFVDADNPSVKALKNVQGVRVIDVGLDPEQFVDQLVECEAVVSSSLHGLIFSDSYNVPNLWVRFSDDVIGGDFKFLDYYSTTDSNCIAPVLIEKDAFDESDVSKFKDRARLNRFKYSREDLLAAFPKI